MATKKLSKVAHVKQMLTQYPDMTPAEIATRAKCSKATVYTVRWEMKKQATTPQEQAKVQANVVTKITPKSVNTRTVSIKEACEVLQYAVKDVDGLDIKVWNDTVCFDLDGNLYQTTAEDAYKVLYAIKTLASHQV